LAAPDLYGVKPPAGKGLVLDTNQIRYCLAEDIRLKTIRPLIDTRSDQEVDRFNARIDDLNSRCADSKYRRGTLERARQEIEARRATIENLARLQWEAEK
jgi:DNA-binding transcriptional MerR regulator